jgi:hypothetical protein
MADMTTPAPIATITDPGADWLLARLREVLDLTGRAAPRRMPLHAAVAAVTAAARRAGLPGGQIEASLDSGGSR